MPEKASGAAHKAIESVQGQWKKLAAALSALLMKVAAVLSWIPAVAKHRKLVKLKAELQEDPSVPEKWVFMLLPKLTH